MTPSGLDTSYWFEYGSSAGSLGSSTARLGAGSGTGEVSVTATLKLCPVTVPPWPSLTEKPNESGAVPLPSWL